MGILDIIKSNNKLDNFPLIKINNTPNLEYIKRKSYQMHRKCKKAQIFYYYATT